MFGYATREAEITCPSRWTLPIRVLQELSYIGITTAAHPLPAARCQVAGNDREIWRDDNTPQRIDTTIVVSTQHDDFASGRNAGCHQRILSPFVIEGHRKADPASRAVVGPYPFTTSTHRGICDQRAARRYRPDQAENHRGYLRKEGARRRGFLGQRILQSRPVTGVCHTSYRENVVASGLCG